MSAEERRVALEAFVSQHGAFVPERGDIEQKIAEIERAEAHETEPPAEVAAERGTR